MPYITKTEREYFKKLVDHINSDGIVKPGHLNYLFTILCNNHLTFKGESYATYNEIIGALECCKLEYYRRKIASYENLKVEENGDV